MANYAKNLIGDWETEQYEPLRDVALSRYQTNWNKLTNDFNALKDKLERNQKLAQIQYGEALNDIQSNAYDRMRYTYEDLANRGLSSSGLVNQMAKANTTATGEEVDKVLSSLLKTSSEGVNTLSNAVSNLAASQSGINQDLANDLAGIGDAEAANAQQYANLVADINESAAQRAATYGSGDDEELDRMYQLITIKEIMGDDETSDDTKYFDLIHDAGVSSKQAESILSSYNYNKTNEKVKNASQKLSKNTSNLQNYLNNTRYLSPNNPLKKAGLLLHKGNQTRANNQLNKFNEELSKYTYEDLYKILGY